MKKRFDTFLSSGEQRQALKEDLEPIVEDLPDYGINGPAVALLALDEGWAEGAAGRDRESESEYDWNDEFERCVIIYS